MKDSAHVPESPCCPGVVGRIPVVASTPTGSAGPQAAENAKCCQHMSISHHRRADNGAKPIPDMHFRSKVIGKYFQG